MTKLSDDQVKHMVERFLGWKIPEHFNPDAGISFKREFNEHTAHPMKHEPTGTNLFDYNQATEMACHMLEDLPAVLLKPDDAKIIKDIVEELYFDDQLSPEEITAFLNLCGAGGFGRPVRTS